MFEFRPLAIEKMIDACIGNVVVGLIKSYLQRTQNSRLEKSASANILSPSSSILFDSELWSFILKLRVTTCLLPTFLIISLSSLLSIFLSGSQI